MGPGRRERGRSAFVRLALSSRAQRLSRLAFSSRVQERSSLRFVIPTGASALPFRRCVCGGRTRSGGICCWPPGCAASEQKLAVPDEHVFVCEQSVGDAAQFSPAVYGWIRIVFTMKILHGQQPSVVPTALGQLSSRGGLQANEGSAFRCERTADPSRLNAALVMTIRGFCKDNAERAAVSR